MSPAVLKVAGIVSALGVVVCIFIAVERYQTNANNVAAMNATRNANPMMQMFGGAQHLEPATPAATKYAIFFAVLLAGCSAGSFIWLSNLQPVPSAPRFQTDFAAAASPPSPGAADSAHALSDLSKPQPDPPADEEPAP